ncbi:MAG: imidazoleglycerol-phosphate dehydratase HisB [Candidatus Margulisiibacteriota bacterium]
MSRIAKMDRKTKETAIQLSLNLDGTGISEVHSDIHFLNHMLDLMTYHGRLDLHVNLAGDTEIDFHHSVEDLGICLGMAFRQALGDAAGIHRYAWAVVPMDEACCQIALDISNRPYLHFDTGLPKAKVGEFDTELVQEFFNAFVVNARVTLHIRILSGENLHHIIESIFKAFGMCLRQAVSVNPNDRRVPSTKGVL